MEQYKLPQMLTADVIDAIARNAQALKAAAAREKEKEKEKEKEREYAEKIMNRCCKDDKLDCCCPKLIKFKFWFCPTTVINKNTECEEDKGRKYC